MTLESLLASASAHGLDSELLARHHTASLELLRRDVAEPFADLRLGEGREAAQCLIEMRAPREAVLAALCAPSVLGAPATTGAPSPEFLDPDVAEILDGVRRLHGVHWDKIDEAAAETLRNLFLAMARDVRVVLVALALRVAMMRSLGEEHNAAASERTPEKIAQETLEVFAPLANRLGIWQFKWELEDSALLILEPTAYTAIAKLLDEKREQREEFVQQAAALLRMRLENEDLSCAITGRSKHVYSIYKKMQRKQVSFNELYDISAVRIVAERVADCYSILGIVHELWTPIPGEFDDYIAMPKSNGYQSLHTAVIGPEGRPLEVQIRTKEMHRFAELGVAAHWAYKEQRKIKSAETERLLLLRRLLDWERELVDPKQFVDSLKTNLFDDQVFVFTPTGDVIDLPLGATPVDFAYRVHTLVGHRCRGARINGQIAPLDTQLKTGDRVEILTHKLPKPSRDWMNAALGYATSASTRAKVRHWFREQERDAAISEGRELIHKELHRLDLKSVPLERIATQLGYTDLTDLWAAVGYGTKRAQSVVASALELAEEGVKPAVVVPRNPAEPARRSAAQGLSLDGISDVLAKPGGCCKPVPGDDVVGFVTRGRGVVIHRRDCSQLNDSRDPERIVAVEWQSQKSERHPVEIEMRVLDRPNLLGEFTSKLTSFGGIVSSARQHPEGDGSAVLRMTVECKDQEQLAHLLTRLARESDVLEARRASSN